MSTRCIWAAAISSVAILAVADSSWAQKGVPGQRPIQLPDLGEIPPFLVPLPIPGFPLPAPEQEPPPAPPSEKEPLPMEDKEPEPPSASELPYEEDVPAASELPYEEDTPSASELPYEEDTPSASELPYEEPSPSELPAAEPPAEEPEPMPAPEEPPEEARLPRPRPEPGETPSPDPPADEPAVVGGPWLIRTPALIFEGGSLAETTSGAPFPPVVIRTEPLALVGPIPPGASVTVRTPAIILLGERP
jgi:hypothetical protein